ncbi:hypothetical protein VmeM32_00173 [Vibrio phage vB_VmeM-32]|nr:hypothetical protein VmeM32_00173 [Vibrio phage vB_VmeM-32]
MSGIGSKIVKFTKLNETYQATRKDGQVITISKAEEGGWVVRYDGDWDGDNTTFAKTKKELVDMENRIESNM